MYVVFGHKGASFNFGELFSDNCCNVCLVTCGEAGGGVDKVWQWSCPSLRLGFWLSTNKSVDGFVELFLFFVGVVLVGSVRKVLKISLFVMFHLGS